MRSLYQTRWGAALPGLARLALGLWVGFATATAWAQAPPNDNFVNAYVLSGTMGTTNGSTDSATAETGEPNHLGVGGASVWFSWTAPASGWVSFDTVGSDYDTLLAVYTGDTVSTLVGLAANDDFDPTTIGPSGLKFQAREGTTYRIVVDGYVAQTGNYVLHWAYNAAGMFQFAGWAGYNPLTDRYEYNVAETESIGVWDDDPLGTPRSVGALITVTRLFGAVGRVEVECATSDETALDLVDYVGGTFTLVFDNYEMSKSLRVRILDDGGMPNFNRTFVVRIINVRLADGESAEVAPPTISPALGMAGVNILDLDMDPVFDNNFTCDTNDPPVCDFTGPTNSVFNFERQVYRTTELVGSGRGFARVYVIRSGTNTAAETVYYNIASSPVDEANDRINTFALQAASDYATPDPPTSEPPGVSADYTPVRGSIAFGQNDFLPKPIDIPIFDDGRVEFNEDIYLQLYKVVDGRVSRWGNVNRSTLTILYEEYPAGALDANWNLDYNLGTVPPINPHPGANSTVYALAVQSDNKTVIGGSFTAYNTISRNRVARINVDGSNDGTFNPGTGANGFVSAVALGSGQVVIGGGFTAFNGTPRGRVARLSGNGSLDTTFQPGSGANGTVWAVAVQSDGKVVIGGEFTSVNGTNRSYVARLNSNGSLDATFDAGAVDGMVNAVAVTATGEILIGGEFMTAGGVMRSGIARLLATGALDATFDPGLGVDGVVYALARAADGKILVGGSFGSVDARGQNNIARLNTDGSLDETFQVGVGADDAVYALAVQADGKVLLGGIFTSVNGTRRVGVARLLAEGAVDTSFLDTAYNQFAGLPNLYFSDPKNFVFALGVQSDGDVMIGGGFARVGGGRHLANIRPNINDPEPYTRATWRHRNNVARLLGGATTGPGNIELAYDDYSVDESAGWLYVSLLRNNGTLGPVSAALSAPPQPFGPGSAAVGVDYLATANSPVFGSSWNITRMRSDGLYGPNYDTLTVVSGLYVNSVRDDVYIDILDNTIVDGDRTANLELLSPNGTDIFFLGGENIPLGTALGRSTATMTIVDNDFQPGELSFSAPEYSVTENGTSVTITVLRTNGSHGVVTVKFATTNGTALAGSDYVSTNGTLTFNQGQVSRSFAVRMVNDSAVEPDEAFGLRLSNPTGGSTIGLSNATVNIIDDDFAPGRLSFSAASYSTNEWAPAAVITVTRTGGSVGVLAVQYATSDGTATNGFDYVGAAGTLTWNSGDIAPQTIVVPLIDDGLVESDETVNLALFGATVGGLPDARALGLRTNATLTIVNDDAYGALAFSTATYAINENGGPAVVTVIRSGGAAETLTLNFAATNGSAVAGFDFTPTNGTLIFGPGEVSKAFTVSIVDNPFTDVARFVSLQLFPNTTPPGVLGSPSSALLNLIDDESVNEPPGSLDTSYNAAAGANDAVHALALQADGKLVAGGDFTLMNNITRRGIARLNTDGTLDVKFSSASGGANGSVRAVASQSDGRVLVGGLFTTFNNVNRSRIARLNYDGSVDGGFNPGAGADNPVYAVAETFVGANRKVLLGGNFITVDGVARGRVARLNDNGSVDAGFNASVDGTVYALAVQSDGKVLLGGDFTSVNGVGRNHLARLNADGTLDGSFDPGLGANDSVRAIALQGDGRILVGGLFTLVNSVTRNHIARLNAGGTLDTTFDPGLGANDAVYAIAVQGDTKILLGGQFTQASGVTRHRITRLNADGSVDPKINFGTGANSFVAALVVQSDGKIIIGGGFTEYDGQPRLRLARLYGGSINGSGSFEFSAPAYSADENGASAVVTVRRRGGTSGAPTGDVFMDVAATDGTATSGVHYLGGTNTLAFPPGEVLKTLTIPILDDIEINADRTVNLTLQNPQPPGGPALGSQFLALLTIVNDDSAISFSSATYARVENAVDGVATINIVRYGSTRGAASADFLTTTNGTATPGVDFGMVTNFVLFAPGQTNQPVTVPLTNDTRVEGNETVGLLLANAAGALLLEPSTATLTIVDDDFAPGQLFFGAPAFVASEGALQAVVQVLRTNGTAGVVTAQYFTTDGSAFAGLDYAAQVDTVVFGDGEASKAIVIPLVNDLVVEPPKIFTVTLTNAGGGAALTGPTTVPVTIADDDVGFSFSTPAYVVAEGGNAVTLTVLRLNGSNGVMTVQYATTNNTATVGSDYTATSGLLTFANGETLKTFTVPILEDALVEGDETFWVVLSAPTGGAQLAAPSVATVAIVDNDAGIALAASAYNVEEAGTNVVLTVLRSNAYTGTVTINYVTADDTASAGADYTPASGTLTFTNGETVKTLAIPIINDAEVEGDETFIVSLFNPTGGAQLQTPASAVVTIVDNDASLAFSSASYAVSEAGVQATVTVLRGNVTTNTVSVSYSTSDGTATNGADYFPASGTLTFTNGETSKSFVVQVIDDTLTEGDETVLLTLSSPVGQVSLITPSAATLTIVDNDGSLIIPAGSALTAESGPVNNGLDPGEAVTLLFAFRNSIGSATTNVVATLLATNGVAAPSGAQSYGALLPGGPSVSRPFSFTAQGTNGGSVIATFRLQQGTNDLGLQTFAYTLGTVTATFSNTAPITIVGDGASPPYVAVPYPSTISAAGLGGVLSKITVTLTNLYHTSPDDLDLLLVGPTGQKMILMSDAGGGNQITNVTLTFDDAAANYLPDSAQIVSGTNRPSNYLLGDLFPSPAPPEPYAATLGAFSGINPNGPWSLYVVDDYPLDGGGIARGWSVTITAASLIPAAADVAVKLTDTPDPVIVGSNLTYTVCITNHGPSTATGMVMTNELPASATFVSASVSQGSVTTNAAHQAVASIGTLAKDAWATVTLVVRPNAVGTLTDRATALALELDPNTANNTAMVLTTVSAPVADLVLSLFDAPDPVFLGSTLTYTLVVSNAGPATATGVAVTNTLPPGVSFVSASPSGYLVAGSVVAFTNLGTVGSGSQVSATIVAKPQAAGTITDSARAGSLVTDPLKGNNSASAKTVVEPVLLSVSRPAGNLLAIAWSAEAPGYVLESATNLTPAVVWTEVTNPPPQIVGGQKVVTLGTTNVMRFFRLRGTAP